MRKDGKEHLPSKATPIERLFALHSRRNHMNNRPSESECRSVVRK
jgi:hypothetical protein